MPHPVLPRRPAFFLLALLLLATGGCRSHPVVTAPPVSPQRDQASVYLAHYDFFHTSLIVPQPGGRAVEYTYADWDVLACGRRTTWTKAKAVLLPSRGTLGRAELTWDGTSDHTLRSALEKCWKLSRYQVDAARLQRLTARLDADFTAAQARTGDRVQERGGMRFVKAPRPYWLAHNCNHALREWLVALGFTVPRGVALADFQTPGATHTFAPGRETTGMRTNFDELVGERPAALAR